MNSAMGVSREGRFFSTCLTVAIYTSFLPRKGKDADRDTHRAYGSTGEQCRATRMPGPEDVPEEGGYLALLYN